MDIRYLNYNPAYLEVPDDNSSSAGVQITAGSLMPMTQANSADATNGRITFSQITAGGTTYTSSGAQTLATIHFKVLQAGVVPVTFDFTSGKTSDCNVAASGADVLTSVVNGNFGTGAVITPPPVSKYKCSGTSCVQDNINGTYTSSNCDNACVAPPTPCTAEAKLCSDGTSVGRTGPNCEFAPCPTPTPTPTPTPVSGVLTGPFQVGMTSEQVKLMQQMLAQDKSIYPEGSITGYYGSATTQAVQKFQCKYNLICQGTPDTTGYGLAGPQTSALLNQVYGTTATGDNQVLIEQIKAHIQHLQVQLIQLLTQLVQALQGKIQ